MHVQGPMRLRLVGVIMHGAAGTRFRISITRRLTAIDDVPKRTVKLFV